MEQEHDYLIVYDGKTEASPILEILTGNLVLLPIVSTENNIHIKFSSDIDGVRTGFNASINTMKKDPICQLTLDYLSMKLKSPSVNKGILKCNWLITAKTGHYVLLKFTKFNVSLCENILTVIIVYFLLFSWKEILISSEFMMELVKNLIKFII